MTLPTSETLERYFSDEAFRNRVDQLFEIVEPYIDRFALSNQLGLDKWYHDTPIWMLTLEREPITRIIHVGPAEISNNLTISVIVHAYKDTSGERYASPKGIIVDRIFESTVKIEPYQIADLLENAIALAKDIKEEDLTLRSTFTR